MVGHSTEISNPIIEDAECVIQCVEYIRHKSPFVKGGFRGNVNIAEDISPPPANENRRNR